MEAEDADAAGPADGDIGAAVVVDAKGAGIAEVADAGDVPAADVGKADSTADPQPADPQPAESPAARTLSRVFFSFLGSGGDCANLGNHRPRI